VDLYRATGDAPDGFEATNFVARGNGGSEIVFGDVTVFVGEERAEEEDGPAGTDFAEGGGFGEVSDGEKIGARVHEACGSLREAMTIGVCFDNGDVAHVTRERSADEVQVALKDGEVDFSPATEREAGEGMHVD
jgi:hypothetical protein